MSWSIDKVLTLGDLSTERVKDELREWTWSDEGLYFVSRHLVGNTRLIERVHKPMLNWAQVVMSTPDALGALRDPRATGKTDGFSIATPYWGWAQPKKEGTPVQGTDTCFAYVMPKKDLASFVVLVSINERWSKCPIYFELFPWVKQSKHWSMRHGFRLDRESVGGLPNVVPLGMESISTSLHPPILIVDDPIHEQNYRSRVLVAGVKNWAKHSHALVLPWHGVRMFVGNHWSIDDMQSEMHPERGEECKREYRKVQVWERGITGCETCVEGEKVTYPGGGSITGRIPGHEHSGPTIPVALAKTEGAVLGLDGEEEPEEYIHDVREAKDTETFMTQHENLLIDSTLLHFKKENLVYWEWATGANAETLLRVPVSPHVATLGIQQGLGDRYHNAGARWGTSELLPLDDLELYILVDPAPEEERRVDRSRFAAALYGVERNGPREFLIGEYADQAPQHEHIDFLLDWYEQWRPYFRRFGIESVGYQKTLKDSILIAAGARGIVTLRESDFEMLSRLKSEGQQIDRIKYILGPKLEKKILYVHPTHRIFRAEHDVFGVEGTKHDLLDAMSNVDRVAVRRRRGGSAKSRELAAAARRRLAGCDQTGYG